VLHTASLTGKSLTASRAVTAVSAKAIARRTTNRGLLVVSLKSVAIQLVALLNSVSPLLSSFTTLATRMHPTIKLLNTLQSTAKLDRT
jgi:hypothetical protein